jgi:hypothetical protein
MQKPSIINTLTPKEPTPTDGLRDPHLTRLDIQTGGHITFERRVLVDAYRAIVAGKLEIGVRR